jgi:hypothetical protein
MVLISDLPPVNPVSLLSEHREAKPDALNLPPALLETADS